MILEPECGRRREAWHMYVRATRRHCCKMGRCWWLAASPAPTRPRARSYTIRRPGLGRPPPVLSPGAMAIRRRCYLMVRFLLQEELTSGPAALHSRNSTNQRQKGSTFNSALLVKVRPSGVEDRYADANQGRVGHLDFCLRTARLAN